MASNVTQFDFSKIEDFDSHIRLSIPDYPSLVNIFRHLATRYCDRELRLVDLGCSTGSFLSSLDSFEKSLLIGVDSIRFSQEDSFTFWEGDAEEYLSRHAETKHSVIVSMFFLQFLPEGKRQRLLALIKEQVRLGATFLVAEKIYITDVKLHQTISRLHIQNKRANFSDGQILDKEKEMEDAMFCKTSDEFKAELSKIGDFVKVWQSYNFMGYIVQGKNHK